MIVNNSFSYDLINNQFINVYNDNNPILDSGEKCYFIFNNVNDYSIPLIGYGLIIHDSFTSDVDKTYLIQLQEVKEKPKVLDKWFYDKNFYLVKNFNSKITSGRIRSITDKSNNQYLLENLFKIDCFFVRNTYSEILKVREFYLEILHKDFDKHLTNIIDFKEILNQETVINQD